jgi:hypothetical protein
MLSRPRTVLRLDVSISPLEVEERFRSFMGIVKSFLLSPTWGRGEPFVGQINGSELKLRVRHAASNGLTRLFYGKILPTPFGARIEGHFRTLRFVVAILRSVWLVLLLGTLALLREILSASGTLNRSEVAAVILGPTVTFTFLVVIEIVARRMGDRDENNIRAFLTRTFADVAK